MSTDYPVGIPQSPFLDETQAAGYLRVKRNTLRDWRMDGRGPRFRKHGARVLYRVEDLDAWSDAHAKSSTSDRSENPPEAAANTTA